MVSIQLGAAGGYGFIRLLHDSHLNVYLFKDTAKRELTCENNCKITKSSIALHTKSFPSQTDTIAQAYRRFHQTIAWPELNLTSGLCLLIGLARG